MSDLVEHLVQRLHVDIAGWRKLASGPRWMLHCISTCNTCRELLARCLDELEESVSDLVRHEERVMEVLLDRLVPDDRDEVRGRLCTAPSWAWSLGTSPSLRMHWYMRSLLGPLDQQPWPDDEYSDLRSEWISDAARDASVQEPASRAEDGSILTLHPPFGTTRWLLELCSPPTPDDVSPLAYEMLGHVNSHVPLFPPVQMAHGAEVSRFEGPPCYELNGLPIGQAQVAWVYWALPRSVRIARVVAQLINRVATGQDHARLLREVMPGILRSANVEDASERLCGQLAEEVRERVSALHRDFGTMRSLPLSRKAAEAHVRALDETLAKHLEGIGTNGGDAARDVRTKAPKRVADNQRWRLWQPLAEGERYVQLLALALWRDRLEQESKRQNIEVLNPGYAKMPKMTASVSWAFGGAAIEVDGSQYVQEPGFAEKVLMPRTAPLLIDSPSCGPEQASLPLGAPDQLSEDQPFAVAVANATQWGAISPLGSKLALLTLAEERAWKGMFVAGTAEQFAKLAYPASKRIQPRELTNVGAAFHELGKLIFYLHDYTKVRPFDTRSPAAAAHVTRDMPLGIGLGSAFRQAVGQMLTGKGHGAFGGAFVLNLSGALALPNNQPSKLRHLVRASAAWNAAYGDWRKGGYDDARLPWHDLDQWAKLTNCYPIGVVEYLAARGEERRKLSNRRVVLGAKRKELLRDIEELADKYRLVRIEKRSSKGADEYRLAPPEEWLEAWARIRSGAVR